jgi:hypothetical protein
LKEAKGNPMSNPTPVSFSWEGTDNPNDPSGVAKFGCDGIVTRVALSDFATAGKLSYLLKTAYEKGRHDAIDRARSTISSLLKSQLYD